MQGLTAEDGKYLVKVTILFGLAKKTIETRIDRTSPEISLNNVTDNMLTNARSIELSGTINEEVSRLTINGNEVVCNSLSFSNTVNLVEGDNPIRISALDLHGNEAVKHLTIMCDQTPPVISNIQPENATWVNTNEVTIQGQVDEIGSEVNISGSTANIDGSGCFSKEISLLTEGENNITISAADPAGNSSVYNWTLYKDTTSPGIIIEPSNETVYDAFPAFSVSYEDSHSGIDIASLSIIIDDNDWTSYFTVTDSNAQFSSQNPFLDGEYSWYAYIRDNAGNETTTGSTFTIQTVPAPEVKTDSGYIDGIIVDADTEEPLKGVMVTAIKINEDGTKTDPLGSVFTNSEGKFFYAINETAVFQLDIEKESYITSQREIQAIKDRHVSVGTVHLKLEDPQKPQLHQPEELQKILPEKSKLNSLKTQ